MDKLYPTAAAAVCDITDGASLAVGGFGLSGTPMALGFTSRTQIASWFTQQQGL